jgi:DNA replication protein DnaC
MTTDTERLRASLKRLGLHTLADIFEREAQKAAKAKQSYVGFLAHLIDEELAAKADRSINARIARARFPAIRTLEAFDFAFQPSLPAPLIRELAELGFLERAENLLLVGPPGVGKSHVASPSACAPAPPTNACCFVRSPTSSTNSSRPPWITPSPPGWRCWGVRTC